MQAVSIHIRRHPEQIPLAIQSSDTQGVFSSNQGILTPGGLWIAKQIEPNHGILFTSLTSEGDRIGGDPGKFVSAEKKHVSMDRSV